MNDRARWIVGRVARLGLDAVVLLGGVARTLATAARPPRPRAGLALLVGDEIARRGVRSWYRVRVHNPGAIACALTVTVDGGRDRIAAPAFRLSWTTTLAPQASEDRWIETSWQDGAALSVAPPAEAPIVAMATAPLGSWWIEASTMPAHPSCPRLRIGGALVA
jgi:hypothetical protein